MNYKVEDINYIIYNNRTYDGVVKNFMPKLEPHELQLILEIEKQMQFVNKIIDKGSSIIIDKEKLDIDLEDIEIFPDQLAKIKISSRKFSDIEIDLLNKKKISQDIIEQYDISPLSQFRNDLDALKILGVTTHPILKRLLGDGISDGLIIPLYKNDKLINSVFRKTNELTKLKYGISVPSIDFWGDEIVEENEIWLCEGLFDMMALRREGKKCISASSCSLNDFQYFKIIKNKPSIVNIFTDNDISGYRSAMKSQKIFGLNGIKTNIFSSKNGKDAAEHFFQLGLSWDSVEKISITHEMINRDDNILDFLKYLENRKF
jgi:hypothetical protein